MSVGFYLRRNAISVMVATVAALHFSACVPREPEPIQPTLTAIQEAIFTPSCALSGCHGGNEPLHGWDLRTEEASYQTLVYQPSHIEPGLNLVEPGDPDNSFLIRKLEGTAQTPRMPMALPKLSEAKITAVKEWIRGLPVAPQPTLVYLQKNVFDVSCASSGCHTGPVPAANLDLSAGHTLASLVNVPSSEAPGLLIDPGHPETSLLLDKLEGRLGSLMPAGGPALSPEDLEAVRGWITSLLPPQPTIEWIQPNVFDSTCAFAGCHDAVTKSWGLDLSPGVAEQNLVGVSSRIEAGEVLIVPGNPDASYLVKKLEGTPTNGVAMPWNLPQIPVEKIQAVRAWIAAMDGVDPDPDPNPDPDPVTPEPTQAWLQANVFNTQCVGCHGNAGASLGLNLTDISTSINRNSVQRAGSKLIVPGDATNSYLVKKIEGTGISGSRMPVGGTVDTARLDALKQWINSL